MPSTPPTAFLAPTKKPPDSRGAQQPCSQGSRRPWTSLGGPGTPSTWERQGPQPQLQLQACRTATLLRQGAAPGRRTSRHLTGTRWARALGWVSPLARLQVGAQCCVGGRQGGPKAPLQARHPAPTHLRYDCGRWRPRCPPARSAGRRRRRARCGLPAARCRRCRKGAHPCRCSRGGASARVQPQAAHVPGAGLRR